MASNLGEQLMEHRLSLSTLARELYDDGHLREEDLATIAVEEYAWCFLPSKSFRTRPCLDVS